MCVGIALYNKSAASQPSKQASVEGLVRMSHEGRAEESPLMMYPHSAGYAAWAGNSGIMLTPQAGSGLTGLLGEGGGDLL